MQSLAFPMRMQENGLLRRDEGGGSLIALLQMMARTPAGSWAACPSFGLRDLFENGRLRADAARLAQGRINEALEELGLDHYTVTEVVRELSAQRETDTYTITVENTATSESYSTHLAYEE